MEFPEPSNDSDSGSNLQRIAIGAGTLIVVVLTVVVAIFLTLEDLPPEEATSTAIGGITATATPLPANLSTPTETAAALPATDASTPSAAPTEEPTRPPSTATATLPAPTATLTPAPTNTPLPPNTPTPLPPAADTCPIPDGWVEYEVQIGDTFATLAARTGAAPLTLQQANCVTSSANLTAGQVIVLPSLPVQPVATSTARPDPNPTPTVVRIIPKVDSISPDRIDEGFTNPITVTIFGENFRVRETGFKAELKGSQGSVALILPDKVSDSDTNFDAIVPVGLPAGTYDLVVANASDRAGVKNNALTVSPPPLVSFSATNYNVDEDEGNAVITVKVEPSSASGTVMVDYKTEDGSATAPDDYTAVNSTLTFAPGQSSGTFTVAIEDDNANEADETITLTLFNVTGGFLGTPASATLTIEDDD